MNVITIFNKYFEGLSTSIFTLNNIDESSHENGVMIFQTTGNLNQRSKNTFIVYYNINIITVVNSDKFMCKNSNKWIVPWWVC